MLLEKGKYLMVPVMPLIVYLSYCMVATKRYHKLGDNIAEELYPFLTNYSTLSSIQNDYHSKLLLSVFEQFFYKLEDSFVYLYDETLSYIEDIRLYVPIYPTVLPQLVNSRRGPPCFA